MVRMRPTLAVPVGVSLAFTVAAAAIYATTQGLPEASRPERVSLHKAWSVEVPVEASDQDNLAFLSALVNDSPLPSGYAINASHGQFQLVFTGMVNATSGSRQTVVTVSDDSPDLSLVDV